MNNFQLCIYLFSFTDPCEARQRSRKMFFTIYFLCSITFSIRTQIDDSTILDGGTQVEYDGKQYIVGSGINDYDVVKSKLCHKLCTYLSIANLLHDKEQDTQLITGCPITHFINKEARQQHSDYYRGRVQIKIKNDLS